ncbi:MAG: VWA domain-containing protein [Spirochaetales bacterium]|nr:VWA domain-containing protein [Spirochaetales bacterium]
MIISYLPGLFFLISIPLIVIMHMIRRQRTRLGISSTFLWEEVLKSYRRRFFIQTFLRNLPLLLQICAALIITLALLHPLIPASSRNGGDDLIIILDGSASMQTNEGGMSRFELGVIKAKKYIEDKAPRTRVLLVSGGGSPTIAGPFTDDASTLRRHLGEIKVTDEPGEMDLILATAANLAIPDRDYRMVLISDGAFELERPDLLPKVSLEYLRVGNAASNVGFTAFSFRKPIDGMHEYEIMAKIKNYSSTPYSGSLSLASENGVLSDTDLLLESDEEKLLILHHNGLLTEKISARIPPTDGFSLDNTAYAVLNGSGKVEVNLVTPGNFFLEQLLTVHPAVEVVIGKAASAEGQFDITIFDRISPPLDFSGRLIIIGAADPSLLPVIKPVIENPAVTGWNQSHPILQSLDVTSFSVYRALGIPRGKVSISSLVHSGDISLLYTFSRPGTSGVGISFAVSESDLALRPAFPVLMNNILTWLGPAVLDTGMNQALAGGTFAFIAESSDSVVVSRPNGESFDAQNQDGITTVTELTEAGFYTVEDGGSRRLFAVNMLDEEESDISPRLVLGDQDAGAGTGKTTGETPGYSPLWRVLVIGLLLFLLAEWYVWARMRR